MVIAADFFAGDTIVKILGLGLSGFGFLLMYMAYNLITRIINTPDVNPSVLSVIKTYMIICFTMTLAVGFFTYINAGYKQQVIADQNAAIQQKTNAFSLLSAAQTNGKITDSVLLKPGNSKSAETAKVVQKKALDTISKYLSKTSPRSTVDSFNRAKDTVLAIHDSLSKINPNNLKKLESFRASYKRANKLIESISTKIAHSEYLKD